MRALLIGVAILVGGCTTSRPESGLFIVSAKAGPSCALVTEPPQPACADRSVANATVFVMRANGVVVARGETDANGRIKLKVPEGGVYFIGAAEVAGLIAPEPMELEVASGGTTETRLHFDTGIRRPDDGDGHP